MAEPKVSHTDTDTDISKEEPYGSLSSGDDATAAVAEYNAAAEQAGWPKVAILSKSRRAAVSQRLRECGGLTGWREALARARASPHLCGQNDRGWTASFDFLTRQSSFAKLMEGNYDPRPSNIERLPDRRQDRPDPALANIARIVGIGQA